MEKCIAVFDGRQFAKLLRAHDRTNITIEGKLEHFVPEPGAEYINLSECSDWGVAPAAIR